VTPTAPPAQPAIPADEIAWDKVKDSTDIAALRKFRADNPTSKFEPVAYAREEGLAWANVHEPPQIADLQQFLNQYSSGAHAAEARKRIDSLKEQQGRQEIKQTLEIYRSAYEGREFEKLRSVWPSVPQSFKKQLQAADKIRVFLDQKEPVISGETAVVVCEQRLEVVAGGKTQSFSQARRFTLRKVEGRWIIETDN
jgi:hypothetical protein